MTSSLSEDLLLSPVQMLTALSVCVQTNFNKNGIVRKDNPHGLVLVDLFGPWDEILTRIENDPLHGLLRDVAHQLEESQKEGFGKIFISKNPQSLWGRIQKILKKNPGTTPTRAHPGRPLPPELYLPWPPKNKLGF